MPLIENITRFNSTLTLFLFFSILPIWQHPFLNHDVLIYAYIGRAIYSLSEMPFTYAFDHKPLLTYLIYGPLAWLRPATFNIYALCALAALLSTAWLAHRVILPGRHAYATILSVLAAALGLSSSYTGNTEIFFVPLGLLAVILLMRSGDAVAVSKLPRPNSILVQSALCATAAFQINYLCGVPLLPTLLYALYYGSRSRAEFLKQTLVFGSSFALANAALLALFPIMGGDLPAYFDLQARFLSGYSESRRAIGPDIAAIHILSLLLAALPLHPKFRLSAQDKPLYTALLLLLLFSTIALWLNGKFYRHYLYMVTTPAALLALLAYAGPHRPASARQRIGWIALPFILIVPLVQLFSGYHKPQAQTVQAFYAPLARETAGSQILSIQTSMIPLFYSDARPVDPIIWANHHDLLYGPSANAYRLAHLRKLPPYVLTNELGCQEIPLTPEICTILARHYKVAQIKKSVTVPKRIRVGYQLYKRKIP